MSYQIDPFTFYSQTLAGGLVTVKNHRGTFTATSLEVDEVLHSAQNAGDSAIAAVSYVLERLSDSAGIDIPDDIDSLVEIAVMIASVERDAKELRERFANQDKTNEGSILELMEEM